MICNRRFLRIRCVIKLKNRSANVDGVLAEQRVAKGEK
jgi:hypothetical protein